MIISTVLRLMRGAAKASLKAGKFAIDTSGKLVKTGARAVKHSRMTPEERREAKRKEKRKDKNKKAIKKTGETAVKATGHIISEGFILFVGLVEDFSVLLIVVILILALMLLVVIVSIFGTFTSVIATESTSIGTNNGTGFSYSTGSDKKAAAITDPYTYDWWGNRDANRLKLTDQWDKDIYDIVACNFELYKHTKSDDYYWNPVVGVGTTLMESGLPHSGMFSYIDGSVDNNKEKEKAQNNMATYLFKAHWCAGSFSPADTYGDGPIGNSFKLVSDESYDYGPFKASNIEASEYELLRSSMRACQGHSSCGTISTYSTLSDNKLYAIYNIAGCIYWDYKAVTIGLRNYNNTESKILECMQAYGLCKDKNSLSSEESKIKEEILYSTYYNKHHGSGLEATSRVVEYLTCMLAYSDNHSFSDWGIEAHDGTFDSKSDFSDFRETSSGLFAYYTNKSGTGYKSTVVRGGKTETIDGTVTSKLASFAKDKGRESQWSDLVSNLTTDAYLYNANMSACVTCVIGGNTIVNYLVDKLGIVFESEDGEDSSIEVSRSTPGGTMTAKNVVATAQKIYSEHGVNSSDPWTYGNYDLVYGQNGKFIECKNSNADWCAMFVTTVLYRAKINGSNMSVGEALHKETGGNFPTSQSADCGYSPCTGNQCNLYTATSGDSNRSYITGSGCVIVHNLGNVPNAYGDSDVHSTATKDSSGKISKDSGYVPKAGDIIIYSWDGYHLFSHVGLVCEDGKGTYDAQTIEGNTGPGSCVNKKNGAANAGKKVSTYVEINYAELERKYGKSSTSSTTDESGVFKVDSFVKNKVKTGLGSLDNKTKKFIDVSVDGTSCKVTTYEKSANDKWDTGPVSLSEGYVGSKGVGSSYENSNITPYGTYYCRTGFGNGTKDSLGIKMSTWHNIGDGGTHIWSGSGTSAGFDGGKGIEINKYYNKSINGGTGAENLTSYVGYAYKYAMFIEYNSGKTAKPGGGSAFFLHVGSQPTAGCVAISESDMLKIAQWADDNTVICIHKSNEVIDRQSSKSK